LNLPCFPLFSKLSLYLSTIAMIMSHNRIPYYKGKLAMRSQAPSTRSGKAQTLVPYKNRIDTDTRIRFH
jgi:hypothetical protein